MIKSHSRFWYFLKKSFLIFPRAGGDARPFVAAEGLTPFYSRIYAEAGPLKRAYWRLLRFGFRRWIPIRAKQLAKKYDLPDDRRREVERLSLDRFMDPRDALINEFPQKPAVAHYVRRFEEAAINRILNPQYWDGTCEMDDKIAFARRCEAHGLPHPPLLATCVNGQITVNAMPETEEIFVKPLHGTGGIGAEAYPLTPLSGVD
ncbi:MAG: hypothetical protein AAFU55_08525, partial [Pseudomonadota bacterium]